MPPWSAPPMMPMMQQGGWGASMPLLGGMPGMMPQTAMGGGFMGDSSMYGSTAPLMGNDMTSSALYSRRRNDRYGRRRDDYSYGEHGESCCRVS